MVCAFLQTALAPLSGSTPTDDAWCQALFVIGVVTTASAVALAVWLALSAVLVQQRARARARARARKHLVISGAVISEIGDDDLVPVPLSSPDLYSDLQDTSPASPLFRMDDAPDAEFFDGDTEVEAAPHRARVAMSLRG